MPDPDWFVFIVIASAVSFGCLVLYSIFSAAQIALERSSERKIRELYAERIPKQKKALPSLPTGSPRISITTSSFLPSTRPHGKLISPTR